MKIRFFGAAGEVGRSCIMVEGNNAKILLDAGVKLGEKEEYPVLEDGELKDVDALVLSHAHLDHSGYIPHIFSTGWEGYVYSTKPTFELTNVLIMDYMRISNPKNVSKEGLQRMQRRFKHVEYHKQFGIKGLEMKLLPAGHILGSASIHISDGKEQLLYTGDINLRSTKLLPAAYTEHLAADTLITESTYGGNADIFPPEHNVISNFVTSIKDTVKQGGKIVVPSFAVGRAQEVLFIIDDSMRSGIIPKVPIYVDGMINRAMRIHRHNVIYCREELQKRILMSEEDPFKSENFHEVTKESRSKVMRADEASIIVTTSGMLTGGPVIRYLKHMAGNTEDKMILVGYQAEGTMGRDLQDGRKEITLEGKKLAVKMKVETYHLSAHADRQQLLRLMGKVNGLRNVFIVHGEQRKSHELYESIKHKYAAVQPRLNEEFEV